MLDLRRIQYVTTYYHEIQGLRIVPFGIWLLLIALGQASGYVPRAEPQPAAVALLSYLLGGFMVLALYKLIGMFYTRHYGSVQPPLHSRPRALSGCLSGAGFLFILYAGMMIGSRQLAAEVAIVLIGLLLYAAWRSGWYRIDYVVLAALLAGAQAIVSGAPAMALNGVAVIAGGLLDHLVLARTLKGVPEDGHAGSV